jgi:hypothetical protein
MSPPLTIPGMTFDNAVNIMQEAVVIIRAVVDAEEHCMQLKGNGLLSSIDPFLAIEFFSCRKAHIKMNLCYHVCHVKTYLQLYIGVVYSNGLLTVCVHLYPNLNGTATHIILKNRMKNKIYTISYPNTLTRW